MYGRSRVLCALLAPVLAVGLTGTVAAPAAAVAAPGPPYTGTWRSGPGVVFRTLRVDGPGGPALGDLLDVDLRDPHVAVGLLHPPVVAARARVSAMADTQRAVAGVNGDFFNIRENHPGVPPTGSAVGPEIADGRALKAAVPDGQRFGPPPPPGATTEDVIGVDTGRTGRMSRLHLIGTVQTGDSGLRIPLSGLNQYALPVDGVGAFTGWWGTASRARAVCGTDERRGDPCSADTAEVSVRRGVVTRAGAAVGAGPIPPETTVLVGREAGAEALRRLLPGDRVRVVYRLAGPSRLRFAVGGFAILRDGAPPPGLDATVRAARTAAGLSRDGRHLYLLVADGHVAGSNGLTLAVLSALLLRVGAYDAMNLDGGGSSTFVLRTPGATAVSVRNVPSAGRERAVANGIGVFVRTPGH